MSCSALNQQFVKVDKPKTPHPSIDLLDLFVSSLRRGHANLLCIFPTSRDVRVMPCEREGQEEERESKCDPQQQHDASGKRPGIQQDGGEGEEEGTVTRRMVWNGKRRIAGPAAQ